MLCTESAGGGGGGGGLREGQPGQVVIEETNPLLLEIGDTVPGRGGLAFGFRDFRYQNGILGFGGQGGGGGGASANVSLAYSTGSIAGRYAFKGAAEFAPGTGGGGGGGFLYIAAANLQLRSGARLIARGGDAHQSIDLGGNGGPGSGGNIFLRVVNNLTIDPSTTIDVSAGLANRLPPTNPNGLPIYEGNIRPQLNDPPALEGIHFGGIGGEASNGMIRFESSSDSGIAALGHNPNISAGPFLLDVVQSTGVSRVFRMGLGGGNVATSPALRPGAAQVVFNVLQQPPGTSAVVLWEGASESRDVHGRPGELEQLVQDPRQLRNSEYVRFRVYFLSNFEGQRTRSIQEIRLPYELESSCP